MFLKSLSIQGFKSFADRTLFSFDSGMTAVVGPNGCGKSNVVDALRWVLGESSVKSLRGGEVIDVIFNGSSKRKAVSMAEVTLVLSGCEHLKFGHSELAVTRRVFRDGKSEYELNKKACRLRDIKELFWDTGLGENSYSVMEQGKIDLILSTKPEDRRSIFEEAAGIFQFKKQKLEAERKLEYTEANLLRVSDVLDEQKTRLKSLLLQVGNAKEYGEKTRALKLLDLHLQHRIYQKESVDLERQKESLAVQEATYETLRIKVSSADNALAELRKNLSEAGELLVSSNSRKVRLESSISLTDSKLETLAQREKELSNQDQADQIKSYQAKCQEVEEKLAVVAEARSNWDARLAQLHSKALEWEAKESEVREQTGLLADRIEDKEEAIQAKQLGLAESKAKRAGWKTSLAELETQLESCKIKHQQSLDELKLAENELELSEEHSTAEKEKSQAAEVALNNCLHQQEQFEQVLKFERNQLENTRELVAESEVAVEVLRRLIEFNEAKFAGTNSLLNSEGGNSGVLGVLGSLLEVEKPFQKAVHAVLAEKWGAIVVSDSVVLTHLVKRLEAQELNGVWVLTTDRNQVLEKRTLPKGAIAMATDGIQFDEELAGLVDELLGNAVVVDSVEVGQSLVVQYPDLSIVTKEGILLSEKGASVVAEESSHLVSMEANLAESFAELERLQEQEAKGLEKCEAMQDQLDQIRLDYDDTKSGLQSMESHEAIINYEKERASEKVELAEKQQQECNTVLEAVGSQIRDKSDNINQLESEEGEALEFVVQSKLEIEKLQLDLLDSKKRLEDLGLKKQAAQMDLAIEKRGLDDIARQEKALNLRQKELEEEFGFILRESKKREERLGDIKLEREKFLVGLEQYRQQVETELKGMEKLQDSKAKLASDLETEDADLRSDRKALERLAKDLNAELVAFTKSDLTLKQMGESAMERYGEKLDVFQNDLVSVRETLIELNHSALDLVEQEDWLEVEKVVGEVRESIEAMGPVNAQAVVEYDELAPRHAEMQDQVNDLQTAKKELIKVIKKLNAEAEVHFLETFSVVSENFKNMFKRLFGDDGEATIQLSDDKNPLEAGVHISVKPPGKKEQAMNLLSGGERAMVAVSLLFSIFQIKPAPFCVLDELDAPLDESNIGRFLEVLKSFEKESQFIVVTHHKKTMAAARLMYGVTMEESGVSKSLSVRMDDYQVE